MIDRRQFLFGGILIGGAAARGALVPARLPSPAPGLLDTSIPLKVSNYRFATATGLIVPPEDEISQRLYDQVLTRVYVDDAGPPIMLLVAYGAALDGSLTIHRPEACYPSAGFEISDTQSVPLVQSSPVHAASFLTAERGGRREQILYWTRIGAAFPRTSLQQKTALMEANLRQHLPDGVLVRLSVVTNDRAAGLALLQHFNGELLSALSPVGKTILLGSGS